MDSKESVVREYSSKFDIGECWGYNKFIALADLHGGFLTPEGALHFCISVRNPTYRSLVRDQDEYIKHLQMQLRADPENQ